MDDKYAIQKKKNDRWLYVVVFLSGALFGSIVLSVVLAITDQIS